MPKILVVDDEANIVELVELYLAQDGHSVLRAYDGREALRLVQQETPDLIVLDIMLPEVDGLEVCRTLRQQGNDVPIIMLTARDQDIDKIVGLELGADDYVTKPFNPRELAARVKAILRRFAQPRSGAKVRELADVMLDPDAHEVRVAGDAVKLRLKEFDLLAMFMSHPQQALSRDQLLEEVWGYDYMGDTRTVDVHIARLRDRLEGSVLRIETVWGIGYKLTMP